MWVQPAYYNRFVEMVKSDIGKPLREELAANPEKIMATAFGGPSVWREAQSLSALRQKVLQAQVNQHDRFP
jgi:hypothetical protein